jgi:hypothetical protein
MIAQGIVHLLTGYDHLAFLLIALLGVARTRDTNEPRRLRRTMVESLKVITAFTVAHSITLTLAATGLVMLASKPVEASIAATVGLTAMSGFWRPNRFQGWPLAFAFGLVHGFGFAGAFREIVSGSASALDLGAFNVGIELAQLAVAIAVVPALWSLMKRRAFDRVAAPAISIVVAGVAGVWFVEQLV